MGLARKTSLVLTTAPMSTPIGLMFFRGLKGEWGKDGTRFFVYKLLTMLKRLFWIALKYVTDCCFNVNH